MTKTTRIETLTTKILEGATGQRYCSNCQQYRSIMGGQWINFNNGRNRRWKCEPCSKKKNPS